MASHLCGFPFWELEFDKNGNLTSAAAADAFVSDLSAHGITDLLLFSHGWNNDKTYARDLYEKFFAEIRKLLDSGVWSVDGAKRVGVAGVFWPSILWPDDAESAAKTNEIRTDAGGAASVEDLADVPVATATPTQINAGLKGAYDPGRQQKLIEELTAMLESENETHAALKEFQDKLSELLRSEESLPVDMEQPDSVEGGIGDLPTDKWESLLEELGSRETTSVPSGGAVAFDNPFKKLWSGAKGALRVATYWQMKERAGVVGRRGLGEGIIVRIANEAPNSRIHLLGHSFGARLVSYSLAGMPVDFRGAKSPVKSLFLLQGAFSHYAFADSLPHDGERSGALKGMADRVDGPLVTTHSLKDYAVGRAYPAASVMHRQDASDFREQLERWGAVGHDGAQSVDALEAKLGEPGTAYVFQKGKWVNLDGNAVIIHGGLPSGAHSDIAHPHTAWAALTAAKLL